MRHVFCILLVMSLPAQANLSYEGEARSLDGGALLYEEHHLLRTQGGTPQERLVLYRCPDGSAFARKLVRYGIDPAAPTFALQDARFGYREGVRRSGDAFEAFYRADAASAEQEAVFDPGENLVIDAGFDAFVQRHWDDLQAGRRIAMEFAVPSRLETLGWKPAWTSP